LQRGLIDELVEPDHLLDRALAVAQELGAIPSATFTATKLAIRRPMIEAAQHQAALTDAALVQHWSSPETLWQVGEFAQRVIKRT